MKRLQAWVKLVDSVKADFKKKILTEKTLTNKLVTGRVAIFGKPCKGKPRKDGSMRSDEDASGTEKIRTELEKEKSGEGGNHFKVKDCLPYSTQILRWSPPSSMQGTQEQEKWDAALKTTKQKLMSSTLVGEKMNSFLRGIKDELHAIRYKLFYDTLCADSTNTRQTKKNNKSK